MIFPTITADNLNGQIFTMPRDFEGALNILLIPFDRWQQRDVNTWIPLAKTLTQEYPTLRYYELPTLPRVNALFKGQIDGVMRGGIPDLAARHATITIYPDKKAFRAALDMPDEERIYVLLVRPSGEVLWHTDRPWNGEKEQSLRKALVEAHLGDTQ